MADESCPVEVDRATAAFADSFLTFNRYVFATLPVVAVVGSWRRNRRIFPPTVRGKKWKGRIARTAGEGNARPLNAALDMLLTVLAVLNPFPPSASSTECTDDLIAIWVHAVEYTFVMILDSIALVGPMAEGFREMRDGNVWRGSRGVNVVVAFLLLFFWMRTLRMAASAAMRRMSALDPLFDRMLLLFVKLICLASTHSLVRSGHAALVQHGLLSFVVSPTDILVITLSGQLRAVLSEWAGLDLDSERRSLRGKALVAATAGAGGDAKSSNPSSTSGGSSGAASTGTSANDKKGDGLRDPLLQRGPRGDLSEDAFAVPGGASDDGNGAGHHAAPFADTTTSSGGNDPGNDSAGPDAGGSTGDQ